MMPRTAMAHVIVRRSDSRYIAEVDGEGMLRVEADSPEGALREMRRRLEARVEEPSSPERA